MQRLVLQFREDQFFHAFTFGNNTFVIVGGIAGNGIILRSTDNGKTWDNATSPGTSSTNLHFGVTF